MASLMEWVEGARPRTLPAAISPVLVGTGAAAAIGDSDVGYGILALAVSLLLQVGVNYANDYSDGIRGTDTARVGPVRLVGQGLAAPSSVKAAAYLSFFSAAVFGLALVAISQTWIFIPIGVACIIAAWRYTGGTNPYGYRGLGEVMVFIFFGLVATLGTLYTQTLTLTIPGLLGAVGVGALASAILVANNLRDRPSDAASGKNTLAVRLGDARTRRLWIVLVAAALLAAVGCAVWRPWSLLALASAGLALGPLRAVRSGATGPALIPVLAGTGKLQLGYAVLLALGLALG
jgi:1,4-dihydroxy-2-naphthoate octaprenyltransferase